MVESAKWKVLRLRCRVLPLGCLLPYAARLHVRAALPKARDMTMMHVRAALPKARDMTMMMLLCHSRRDKVDVCMMMYTIIETLLERIDCVTTYIHTYITYIMHDVLLVNATEQSLGCSSCHVVDVLFEYTCLEWITALCHGPPVHVRPLE